VVPIISARVRQAVSDAPFPRWHLVSFAGCLGRGCFAQACASKASPTSLEGVLVLPVKRGFGGNHPQTVHAHPSNDPSLRHTNSLPLVMDTVYAESKRASRPVDFKLHHYRQVASGYPSDIL
jgi:hypothetical protein